MSLHWLVGVFVAGLFFEQERIGRYPFQEMRVTMVGVSNRFLGPIFFASVGLAVDLHVLAEAPPLLLILTVLAFASKILGVGLPAWAMGYSQRDSREIGVGMCACGGVMLIVLDIGMKSGALDSIGDAITDNLFSALVLVSVLTTLGTPLLLRLLGAATRGRRRNGTRRRKRGAKSH